MAQGDTLFKLAAKRKLLSVESVYYQKDLSLKY